MKKSLLTLPLLLAAMAGTAQTLPQDATFRTGKLRNGLTYYIRHNAKEKGIADFYIAQRVGSILETPGQRGLAHFLEHMAFNGTENFRGAEGSPGIVEWCERHGVKFGANLNAYTSVDETVYNISAVPVTSEAVIDSTLLILHDWSHYLLLDEKEIDKERGVIHEEWRNRRSGMAAQRLMEEALPVIYQGTKYADCLPIGSMDIVDNFHPDELRDYYHKWYRPDLQAIVVVGDIDVDDMQRRIVRDFDTIPMPANAMERPFHPVPDNKEPIIVVRKDAEQPIMLVTLYMKRDATPPEEKRKEDYQRANYLDGLIDYMVDARLEEMQKQEKSPCLSVSARNGGFLISRSKDAFSLSFGAREENVQGSFAAAVGTVERIRQHGFTLPELERAKAFSAKASEKRYNSRADRRNSHYVGMATRHFLHGEPMIDAETAKTLADKFAREVTLDEVNAYMRTVITNQNQVLVAYAPDKTGHETPTEAQLGSYLREAQARTYAPYEEAPVAQKLMSKLPKEGKILSETTLPHGVRLLRLGNGVNVYHKQTDFDKDQVMVRLWGEGGTSLYPDHDAPNFSFITTAISKGGVAGFDEATLSKMLAGKTVSVMPRIGDETQAIGGSSSVRDVETLMQLTHLYFTQPRRDEAAFQAELDRMSSFLANREANPSVAYKDSVTAIAYGDSPRLRPVKRETLPLVSYDRVMEIYKERFSDANGFNMIVIGNISTDSLRPLLRRYVASLPSAGRKETFAHTHPQVRDVDETHVFRSKMQTPTAKVTVLHTWSEAYDAKSDLTLDMLGRVLQIAYIDSVREEKSGVYGVSVQGNLDKHSAPTALLRIGYTCDPQRYEELAAVVDAQLRNIAAQDPLESSVEKVRKYLVKQCGQARVTNNYWNYVLYNMVRNDIDFDDNYTELVQSIQAADIQAMAKRILASKRRIEVTMLPL